MKHNYLYFGLMAALAVSCTMEELVDPNDHMVPVSESFYAYTESRSDDAESRVYIDASDSYKIRWNKNDRITVFGMRTVGLEYKFLGDDGSSEGAFTKVVAESSSAQGEVLPAVYAVYPHSEETTAQSDGKISFNLPATQYYVKDDSFGKDANVMVAKTDGDVLLFKNAVGYLTVRLYAENSNVSVSSITLEGNKGEILAGPSTIEVSGDENIPSLAMTGENGIEELRLFCKDVVTLSTSSSECKEFWFVLPPMTFSEGFKITVATSNGGVFEQSTPNPLTIERNRIRRMAPLQVKNVSGDNTLTLTNVKKVFGIARNENKELVDKTYTATYNSSDLSYTFTMPTYTDFSHFDMTFEIPEGTVLKADDKVIESGVTQFDASQPVALTVCKDNKEKRYTLNVRNTGLPVVRITTEGFTLETVESYENSLQSSDGLDHRIWLPDSKDTGQAGWSASVRIDDYDGSPGMEGSWVETQIKGRGNYTWKWEKKPYAFKFKDSRSVLGMPAHKRWILLANWRDHTLLRNDASFWLSERSGLPYTVRGKFVELEFNGEHRGNYYLCEQIKVDGNRVAITEMKDKTIGSEKTGGFLMEIDSYWDEANKFKSKYFDLKYMFKEPDEDRSEKPLFGEAYDWMENRINEFERVLMTESCVRNKEYERYLDVDSAIMFMLLNELTGNRDFFQNGTHAGPHSTYLYKDKDVSETEYSPIFMGPIWDLDYETFISQSNIEKNFPTGWRGFDNSGYYYYFLCYNQDFVDRVIELWDQKKSAFAELPSYITLMAGKLELSQQFDYALWPYSGQENRNDNHDYYDRIEGRYRILTYQQAIERMKTCFTDRVSWIDGKMHPKNSYTSGAVKKTNPSFEYANPESWDD